MIVATANNVLRLIAARSATARRAARAFVGLLAMTALVTPSLGAALDHHFAERDARHTHMFLGHSFVTEHKHLAGVDHAEGATQGNPGTAIAVFERDASGAVAAPAVVFRAALMWPAGTVPTPFFRQCALCVVNRVTELAPAPPEPPPEV